MIAPANSACRIASITAHNTRGADGIHAEFAITAQNRDISRGGGNYKCRVESVECKVKGCSDFTTLSIPHDQFTAHNAAFDEIKVPLSTMMRGRERSEGYFWYNIRRWHRNST